MKHIYSPHHKANDFVVASAIVRHVLSLRNPGAGPCKIHIKPVGENMSDYKIERMVGRAWIRNQEKMLAAVSDESEVDTAATAFLESEFVNDDGLANAVVVLSEKTFNGLSMSRRAAEIREMFEGRDTPPLVVCVSLFGNTNEHVLSVFGSDGIDIAITSDM